ncbi:histidine N-acetyltransferase-like isoform X2 [Scyliorhinus canicula]|uniref:histidine N-acetyltransferase-like isoform X2 n=1 Tax=Scyliorhinus canicula TaxID=7830 RepID=UPI0018F66ADC|nr:histidine N-acetyltransferase-like isoform X2 [Scyliorhinus canicula]
MGLSLSTCNRAMRSSAIQSYLRAPGGRPMGRPGVRSYTTRQIGLCSSHIVDDGQSALMEDIKVAASERGKGAARLMYKHLIELLRTKYPEVKKQILVTDTKLNKGFCVLGKQSLISLKVPSINVPSPISEVISNMKKRGDECYEQIPLQPDDVRSIFLNRTVIDTLLPGGRVIQNAAVFKPLESNLDILLKRDIVWRADRKVNPRALSLATAPYIGPMGNRVFVIDMFGQDLLAVKNVFLAQLQSQPPLQDNVICLLGVNPSLSPQISEFCINEMRLEKGKQYWNDEVIVEDDILKMLWGG